MPRSCQDRGRATDGKPASRRPTAVADGVPGCSIGFGRFTVKFRRLPISRKQRHLPALFVSVLKDLDSLTPRCSLAIIYLAKIKNMALDDLIVNRPMVFNDTPGAMFFAVFDAALFTKKHASNVARKRQ